MDWYSEKTERPEANDGSDWYRPLKTENSRWVSYGPHGPAEDSREPKEGAHCRKKETGRPARIVGLIILCVLILGAGIYSRLSSAAAHVFFSDGSDSGFSFSFGDPAEDPADKPAEYPDTFADFFDSYFETEETEVTDVRIEEYDGQVSFSLETVPADSEPLSLHQLYVQCADSVVSIKGYADEKEGYNWGTGVVLTSDGLILTNTHVINNCDSSEVIVSDGTAHDARLVGADAISDLAVLKIDAEGLRPAEFGESGKLTVGDDVAAIGNPLGDTFTGTLTNGIISAIERDITYNGRSMTLLQTNTALNEGNSGGALFNMYGQVIGITNMKMMSTFSSIEGIGFAIPSATVMNVVNSLILYGEVLGRPSIGITVGQIPANVAIHYEMPEGLYISAVSEGSDAEKKGVLPGDVLTAVDGIPVTDVNEVNDMKNAKNVGDTMRFSIWRNGTELEIEVSLVDTNHIYK